MSPRSSLQSILQRNEIPQQGGLKRLALRSRALGMAGLLIAAAGLAACTGGSGSAQKIGSLNTLSTFVGSLSYSPPNPNLGRPYQSASSTPAAGFSEVGVGSIKPGTQDLPVTFLIDDSQTLIRRTQTAQSSNFSTIIGYGSRAPAISSPVATTRKPMRSV